LLDDEAMTANARLVTRDWEPGHRAARREQAREPEWWTRRGEEAADHAQCREAAYRASASDRKRRDAQL